MLLITLQAAKEIMAEQCSPTEKAGQDLELAKHMHPLGRAEGLDALPHCYTHFNQDNPSTRQAWVKGQTLCTDTKPQAHGPDFSWQPPSCSTSPNKLVHHLHTQHTISQGRSEAPTPHRSQRVTGGPWIQDGTSLQLLPQSTHPGKPSTSHQTSGHGIVLKDRKESSGAPAPRVWPGL